jgi:hypothetical protein
MTPRILRPAQSEVHRTAHDQDLVEVPKRAALDRAADGERLEFSNLDVPNSEPTQQDK